MLVKINVSDKEMQLVINSLAEMGKPIIKKAKPTTEDKKTLKSIVQGMRWSVRLENINLGLVSRTPSIQTSPEEHTGLSLNMDDMKL